MNRTVAIDDQSYFNLLKVFSKSTDLVNQLDEWIHQHEKMNSRPLPIPILKSMRALKLQIQKTTELGLRQLIASKPKGEA